LIMKLNSIKMKWYTIVLLLSLAISIIAVDIDDNEEEIEDARDEDFTDLEDADDDEVITLGELRELEKRLQRDPVPGRRRRRRRRRSWRGRRFFERVKPFIPIAVGAAGKKRDASE